MSERDVDIPKDQYRKHLQFPKAYMQVSICCLVSRLDVTSNLFLIALIHGFRGELPGMPFIGDRTPTNTCGLRCYSLRIYSLTTAGRRPNV